MAARMTRQQLKQGYLRAMAQEDPLVADFYFQAMKRYDDTLKTMGKKAARATLPKLKAKRKSGRLDLSARYLAALKAGDVDGAAQIQRRIVQRDKAGLADAVDAFKQNLTALR